MVFLAPFSPFLLFDYIYIMTTKTSLLTVIIYIYIYIYILLIDLFCHIIKYYYIIKITRFVGMPQDLRHTCLLDNAL